MEIQPDGSHQALVPAKKEDPPTTEIPTPPPTSIPPIDTKKPDAEEAAAAPEPDDPSPPSSLLTPPPAEVEQPAAPERAPKPNRWAYLPPRDHPARVRIAAQCYVAGTSDQQIDTAVQRDGITHRVFIAYTGDPRTMKEAQASSKRIQWEEALRAEVKQLEDTGTIEWVGEKDVPKDKTKLNGKVVLETKRNGEGLVQKHKCRIVVRGFLQVQGKDYHETFAPTAQFITLRALVSLAAREDWNIHQFDVTGAYLKGDLEEELYMRVTEGVDVKGLTEKIWRLLKPLYGLKQSGRQWKKKLDEIMRDLGFEKSAADDCLYVLKEDGKVVLLVLVYVNDGIVAGPDHSRVVKFKKELNKHTLITDGGKLHYLLGIRFRRDRKLCTITLDQSAYTSEILRQFGMQDSAPVRTPLNPKERLTAAQSPTTDAEQRSVRDAYGFAYLEAVGSLLYNCQTRPDIAHAVGVLARYGSNPGKAHFEALKRVLRYLRGTHNYGLTLGGSEHKEDLIGWTEADWADDEDTRRSTSGFVFEVAGGAVLWSSKRQPTVALSMAEAELMAASNATKEAIWLRTLLGDMGYEQITANTMYEDNNACILISRNPGVSRARTKHIDIRHHFIRERVAMGEIDIQFCSTKDMLADMLTKQLPREAFKQFRSAIRVHEV